MFSIILNGVEKKAHIEKIGTKYWVHLNGETIVVDLLQSNKRSKSGGGSENDKIVSPMPGKITKIFVKEGDHVKQGQALLVMEAMKMEYTLKADLDGLVEKTFCQLNDMVPVGKVLIQLKSQVLA